MHRLTTILLSLILCNAIAQQDKLSPAFNFGFEQYTKGNKLPNGWFRWGADDYTLKTDSTVKHTGNYSVLIESTKDVDKNSFGCVAMSIPAEYLGKEIEIRASVRVEDIADSETGVMIRIDDKNRNVLESEHNRYKNLKGVSFWNTYSVTVPFPAKAKTIYIGAMLSGYGKMWVDDFQVLIDGKDITKAKRKAKIELKADRDHEFDSTSGIAQIPLTSKTTEDLYLLGKLWGFLKYYHPAIAKGNYNWDYELFRILPKVLASESKQQRNSLLSSWISDLGTVMPDKPFSLDSSTVKLYPDLAWLSDTSLFASELILQLNKIKNAKRTGDNYYVDISGVYGVAEFTNENPHDTLRYPDVGFQLLSLYRYWNIINYFYPYKNLFQQSWDSVLMEFIPRFVHATTELQYKQEVLLLITRINDANANILAPNPVVTAFKGINRVPVDISFVENKAVVTGFTMDKSVEKPALEAGDVILRINEKAIGDIITERTLYTPASNEIVRLRNIAIDLLRTNDSVLTITIQRGDSIKTIVAKCYARDRLYKLKNMQKKDTCFTTPAVGVAYINASCISSSYLQKVMPTLYKNKGLIIDLRGSQQESIASVLDNYLAANQTPFAYYTNSSVLSPGLFMFADKKAIGGESRRRYRGKVVVLINEQTQGLGEYNAMAFKAIAGATIIGSTTAGANGNLADVYLPGGIHSTISSIGIYFPDKTETQCVGIAPHITVFPTVKAIAAGKDELIEKAIQLMNKAE